MEDCIFCKVAKGEMDADIVYSDEQVVAFKDINPQAPVHILVIPRRHIRSILELGEDDSELLGRIIEAIRGVVEEQGLAGRGVRILTNVEREAGQSVFHLHFHVLGGRRMLWPPG